MSTIPSFKRLQTGEELLQRLQDNIGSVLDALTKSDISKVNIVTVDIDSASTTAVQHGMGRPPLGFVLVNSTADTRVWRDATKTQALDKLLYIATNQSGTVTLLVF